MRIEEMLLDPAAHRWVRVSNADIGEPGCKHWHVRPRGGILGMFVSWWRVVISSGCPLPQYCAGMAGYGQHFAQVAANYDSLRREATDDAAAWLVAAGDLRRGHALVDIGCGTGAMTALLTSRAGVHRSRRRRLRRDSPRARLASARALPLRARPRAKSFRSRTTRLTGA